VEHSVREARKTGPRGARPPRRNLRSSPAAHGEPMIWLMGGALVIAIAMILGLLALVLREGAATFWPARIVELTLADGTTWMGEVARQDSYVPEPRAIDALPPAVAERARAEIDANAKLARRLLRIGNFELTGDHFKWIDEATIERETEPEWAMVVERQEWGRFYGVPEAYLLDGVEVTMARDAIWEKFEAEHPAIRESFAERKRLEEEEIGRHSRREEDARLALREIEIRHGPGSAEHRSAAAELERTAAAVQAEYAAIRAKLDRLNAENARHEVRMRTAGGQITNLRVVDIVRMYPANRLDGTLDRAAIYFSRWGEFLGAKPRNMNTEGGVYPAIFGTVLMTLIMSLLVVPLGVLAALYLREYAKAGPITTAVRIAVNNLAGVPSIVFGVFGLGFFCYVVGGSIDRAFFAASLPNPTFGTGGLMWASLTLALLTLPVVIVAVEEALAAVPGSMREGSYACGASKWQTIRRIVLPRAMPGIMTGAILAMARGAGEVAPLMLVGAVKMAEKLPVDANVPFLHPERSFMHLGFYIFDLGFQSPNSEAAKPMVFTTTLLLIVIVATLNLAAIFLRARLRRKFVGAQF
jgi:phosphate transport system permease protein